MGFISETLFIAMKVFASDAAAGTDSGCPHSSGHCPLLHKGISDQFHTLDLVTEMPFSLNPSSPSQLFVCSQLFYREQPSQHFFLSRGG